MTNRRVGSRLMALPARILGSVLATLVIASLATMLSCVGCESEGGQREAKVILWARKNGLRIDRWQAGQLPDHHFDEVAWIAEGRAIPGAERILQQFLQKPDNRIEPILVVRGLGYVGTANSVPMLKAKLEDDWDLIRHEAIWSLGEIGGDEAIRILAHQVEHGRTDDERRLAALVLSKIGDPIGIDAMEAAIESLREEQAYIERALADLRRKVGAPDGGGSRPASRPAVASSRP